IAAAARPCAGSLEGAYADAGDRSLLPGLIHLIGAAVRPGVIPASDRGNRLVEVACIRHAGAGHKPGVEQFEHGPADGDGQEEDSEDRNAETAAARPPSS